MNVSTSTTWSGLQDDLNAIQAQLQSALNKAMPHVADALLDSLEKHIQEDVYDTFTPTTYRRRYEDGGLIDFDGNTQIHADADSAGIFYHPSGESRFWHSPLNGDALIERIESGEGYEWSHHPGERPFFSRFVFDMLTGGAEQAAVDGLNLADPTLGAVFEPSIIPDSDDWGF